MTAKTSRRRHNFRPPNPRSLALTGAGLTATEDYRPWPRVLPKCLRCRAVLADCACWDEYFARVAS